MAKYLATSLAMENVVSEPRVMRSCLPISTTSMSLVGLESRSTMLPASLAAVVPVFMATPTSAWASAGASLVPSPVMATSLPPSCSCLIRANFASGVASARKSSTPASWAMAAAVRGLSPVIITVRMPMERISANFSWMPSFTTSLSSMTPRISRPVGHDQWRGAGPRDALDDRDRDRRGRSRPARRPTASPSRPPPCGSDARRSRARTCGSWPRRARRRARPRGGAPGCRSAPWPGPRWSDPRASRRPATPAGPRRPGRARCGRPTG